MVIYLDLTFFVNGLADAAALYAAGRLSGVPVKNLRLAAVCLLGGTYGAACAVPKLSFLSAFPVQLAAAAGLVRLGFGKREGFLRRLLLFFLISCGLAGAVMAAGRVLREQSDFLETLDWRVFFLAGGGCFLFLSTVFRGGVRHGAAGQLCPCVIERGTHKAALTALLDTGNTLVDGFSGSPVLTVYWKALNTLWTAEERKILACLELDGAASCLEKLGGGFRLLPYQAVGVRSGLLLCFRADRVRLNGQDLGRVTVALSPTPVSDGGGYAALWGGEPGKEAACYAA